MSLTQGADYVRALSGLDVPIGGAHPLMGTHNRVMATGNDTFFEIIAIDPAANIPPHARWFGLGDPAVQARLTKAARPHAWVLNSDNLDRDLDIAKQQGINLGTPRDLTRGGLTWRFAVRDDGAIPLDGAAPMIMEWPEMPTHPAAAMPDFGAHILRVDLQTPHADRLQKLITALGGDITPVTCTNAETTTISVTLALQNGQQVMLI